jgi:hypothetical protein
MRGRRHPLPFGPFGFFFLVRLVLGLWACTFRAVDQKFELLDPNAAQAFLRRFPPEVQRRGHDRFRSGAVESLTEAKTGAAYSAVVQDSAWKNEVSLSYDPVHGWDGFCSCPVEVDCAHVFAAMSALLAEHRMTVVRQLSTGQPGAAAALASLKAKAGFSDTGDLGERIMAATSRALSKETLRFVKHVHDLYQRCCQTRQISSWDIYQLGFQQMNYSWNVLKLWPSFPDNEYEFWLYLANFLKEHNVELPEFMQPITDFSIIADRLARWRRTSEIEKWKHTLGSLQPIPEKPVANGEIDLRLVICGDHARLQWLRPGQSQFEPLRQQQFRQLESDYNTGCLNLPPEAELLWQLFTRAVISGMKLDLDSMDPQIETVLNRLLRTRALNSRIVTGTVALGTASCPE